MTPKSLPLVSVVIKGVLLFLIVVVICIASYGIFGSDAYKTRGGSRKGRDIIPYDRRHVWEYASIVFAVLSFIFCCTAFIFHVIPHKRNVMWIVLGDIGVCTASATLLLFCGNSLLWMVAAKECNNRDQESSFGEVANSGVCGDWSSSVKSRSYDCVTNKCREKYLSFFKLTAGAIALLLGLFGFCGPCGLAMKIHKRKEPENAGVVMGGGGGYQEQPGGVAEGSPAYPMYVAPPPPEYQQPQYGGAYEYATPQTVAPQMSPSQNPVMMYPQGANPPQGIPQYAPQGGQ